MIYGDRPNAVPTEYASPLTFVRSEPATVKLMITRGVTLTDREDVVKVTLLAKNLDKREQVANKVVLTDTLPADSDYIWNSARLARDGSGVMKAVDLPEFGNEQVVVVVGTNPYRFELGSLAYGAQLILTYEALRHKE
jgi:hypothetical protein